MLASLILLMLHHLHVEILSNLLERSRIVRPADDLLKRDNVVQVLMWEEWETFQFLPDGVEGVADPHGVNLGLKYKVITVRGSWTAGQSSRNRDVINVEITENDQKWSNPSSRKDIFQKFVIISIRNGNFLHFLSFLIERLPSPRPCRCRNCKSTWWEWCPWCSAPAIRSWARWPGTRRSRPGRRSDGPGQEVSSHTGRH